MCFKMKYKLLTICLLGMFLFSLANVSAFEYDNVKSYDAETKTIEIRNSFNLLGIPFFELDKVADIKLNTPLNNLVPIGYQKVAEFEITNYEDYNDVLKTIKFYDKRDNMKSIERQFDYKYKTTELVDVNDYKMVCSLSLNGTQECNQEVIGTHKEEREVWNDLLNGDFKDGEVTTIGIFTDVQKGDKVEWIPTFFGVEIDEWASWTASLNVDLISYYSFEEASGDVIDLVGDYDLTNNGADREVTGKIGNAYNFDGGTDYLNGTISESFSAITVAGWYNGTTDMDGYGGIITFDSTELFIRRNSATNDIMYEMSGRTNFLEPNENSLDGDWHFFVFTWNDTSDTGSLWVDNVLLGSDDGGDGTLDITELEIGRMSQDNDQSWKGEIDEVGIWSRTLSSTEISELWNDGDGLTFSEVNYITYDNTNYTINCANATINYPIDTIDYSAVGQTLNINYSCDASSYLVPIILTTQQNFTVSNETSSREVVWTTKILENNRTYNLTSYETARETFSINVTANSSLTAVTLDYNGTDYPTSQSGNIWSYSMDIPTANVGNQTIDWKFTYAGSTINSDYTTYQNVSEIIFTLCNASYSDDFLNITFKDEADLSNLNASIPTSTFTYYLGSGTVTKEYDYINNTDNYNYLFCATPDRTFHVEPYLQYKRNADYPQRIWNPSVQDYNSTLSTQILYLLESADGIYVTIQVVNSATQLISGVDITATREISGTDTIVAAGTTGSDGTVTFWLNPDFSHDFELTKVGYTDYSTTFTPTQTSYTITIGEETETENSTIRGIDYTIIPTNTYLVNDTAYTFGFTLTSSYWDVDDYGFNLRLSNGTKIDGGNTGVEGTDLTIDYNVNNQTIIYLDYYWFVNDVYTRSSRYWIIQNTELTGWSIANFFTDLNLYLDSGIYGLDNFGRTLIVFLILFVSIGIMSYKYGATSPLAVSSLIFGIIFFFDVVVGLIPTIRGIEYLPTFLAFLVLVLAIFNEVRT